jgi:hypothetical protein
VVTENHRSPRHSAGGFQKASNVTASAFGLGDLGGRELKARAYVADLDLDGLTLVAVVVLEDSVFERIASLPALAGENPQPKAKSPAKPGSFKERKPLRSLRLGMLSRSWIRI